MEEQTREAIREDGRIWLCVFDPIFTSSGEKQYIIIII